MKIILQLITLTINNNQMDMQEEREQEANTLNVQAQQPVEQVSPVQQLKAALSLAKTMPPSKIRKNMIGITTLAPQIEDILLQKVYLPLQIDTSDPNKPFLRTQFNRDGDSYRSPHSNTYFPESEGGYLPSEEFRNIEELGNLLFSEYTKLYYGGNALGSFYITQGDKPSKFSCGYFAKKNLEEDEGFGGSWDSFNVVDIEIVGEQATFNLSTTIMIEMLIKNPKQGEVDLTGFLKHSKTEKKKLSKDRLDECLVVVGEMVEELETVMRQKLDGIYVSKTKEIIFSTRLEYTVDYEHQRRSLAEGLKQIHLKG